MSFSFDSSNSLDLCGADGFIVGNDGKGIPFDNKFSTGGYDTILFELWNKWNPNKIDEKSRTLGLGYTSESTWINYVSYQKKFMDMLQDYSHWIGFELTTSKEVDKPKGNIFYLDF